MKRLLGALALLVAVTSVQAVENPAMEYVSVSCPAGDITLRLDKNKTFALSLRHWDENARKHTKTEAIGGTWSYVNNVLTLKGKAELSYLRDKAALKMGSMGAEIDAFTWKRSSAPTFADGFQLVERVAADKFFLSVTPAK